MISYCGMNCEKCGAFIATQKNDDELRAKVAKEWSEIFNVSISPEQINCTGCASSGVKVFYCEQMCKVRKCAIEKDMLTCASCESYACAELKEIFKYSPQAQETLDVLRGK